MRSCSFNPITFSCLCLEKIARPPTPTLSNTGTTIGQVRNLIIQSISPNSVQIQNLKVSMSGKTYNLLEVEGDKSVGELDLYPRFRVKILYSSSEKNVVLRVNEKLSKSLIVMTQEDKAEEDEKDGVFLDIEQDIVPIIVAPSSKSDDEEEKEEEEKKKNSTQLLTSLPPPDLNMICTAIEKKWKDELTWSIWDLGGQDTFHALHTLFMTRQGVYLLVFDMHRLYQEMQERDQVKLDDDEGKHTCNELLSLLLWLQAVSMYTGGAPVVLVYVLREYYCLSVSLSLSLFSCLTYTITHITRTYSNITQEHTRILHKNTFALEPQRNTRRRGSKPKFGLHGRGIENSSELL